MYKPGVGAWFMIRVTVTADGKTTSEFDYDHEPEFSHPISPSTYVTDQYVYPTDEDKQPEWLRRRLAEGYAELNAWSPEKRPEWLNRMVERGEAPAWLTSSGGEFEHLDPEQAALAALVEAVAAELPEGAVRVEYRGSFAATMAMDAMSSYDAAGRGKKIPVLRNVQFLVNRLHDVMYKPGVGAWFTVRVAVTADGQVVTEFDYTNEPEFSYPLSPEGYVEDQYFYPMAEDRQPEWLKQRLAEGYAEIRTWDPKEWPEWLTSLVEKGEAPAWLTA
jgi:hypothetical protein